MSRKGKSFVVQPVVLWGTKNEDQCFGRGRELDDRRRNTDLNQQKEKEDCGIVASSSSDFRMEGS